MKTRVLIHALPLRKGGGRTHILNLVSQPIPENLEVYVVKTQDFVLPEKERLQSIDLPKFYSQPLVRLLWERVGLPKLLRNHKISVLFAAGGPAPTIPGVKLVTAFQNMTPFMPDQIKRYPLGYLRARLWLLRSWILNTMKKADLVLFTSNYAKDVIAKNLDISQKKNVTIPHGLNEAFVPHTKTLLRPSWLPSGSYMLYVSSFDYYKNQLELVQAYGILKAQMKQVPPLVLLGNGVTKYEDLVKAEIQKLNLSSNIHWVSDVPFSDLPAAYQMATLLLYPSTCENCPNILIESLGAARPILCSNMQPMPEFGEDAVEYFDPRSPENMASQMANLLANPKKMDALAQLASKQSQKFSWANTAKRTWASILSI